ncbi:MAG: hypothetical protein ACM3X1_10185, partial [Ignavibacteriales bacterium]
MQLNDYSSSFDQRFKIALEEPYAVNTDLFFKESSHSLAFATTERANSSDFVNGSSIGSADENGTKITLRGLLTDLGDKGRWKSLLDQGLEKLQQKYPDKKLSLEYQELPTNDTRNEFLRLMSNGTAID